MRHLSVFGPAFSHVRQNPFAAQAQQQATRDNFWNEIEEFFEGARNQAATFEPHADVEESENGFKITVDLPGVNEADIDLKLEDKKLTLKATRARKADSKTEYSRNFRLPPNANGAEIQAEMKNGVLEITIPKSAETQPKSIPIKSA